MTAIGGFFELELGAGGPGWHPDAVGLASGRACLNYILRRVQPRKLHLPFYCCDAVLEPLRASRVAFEFYPLGENLEPLAPVPVGRDEQLLYINYFGLKRDCVERLRAEHGARLIVDNVQAFFEPGAGGAWAFNSARKFFGVPDGGYLTGPEPIAAGPERNDAIAVDHLVERLLGRQASAYDKFVASERHVSSEPRRMSVLSERLLARVDYAAALHRRRENFSHYARALDPLNELKLGAVPGAGPFCYPFLPAREICRADLHRAGIFVPQLWRDVIERGEPGFHRERELAARLLPLPVDHRYGAEECGTVVRGVLDCLNAGR